MTLCLLSYDAASRRGTLTNAGQLAPYRISGGRIESLSLPSFPLGLFPDKQFPSREYSFAAGDLVVLLSDGLVEATDDEGEPFGFERFEGVLRDSGGAGAAALRDALLAALAAHTGGRPSEDDRTLVILTLD
jgi:serine phosphatase RsbU (regulator of sigma subunit)